MPPCAPSLYGAEAVCPTQATSQPPVEGPLHPCPSPLWQPMLFSTPQQRECHSINQMRCQNLPWLPFASRTTSQPFSPPWHLSLLGHSASGSIFHFIVASGPLHVPSSASVTLLPHLCTLSWTLRPGPSLLHKQLSTDSLCHGPSGPCASCSPHAWSMFHMNVCLCNYLPTAFLPACRGVPVDRNPLPSPADCQHLECAGHKGVLSPHWGQWTDGWMNALMQSRQVGALGSAGEVPVGGGTVSVAQ